MNTINEYVESMFLNVPKTAETEQLKEDILANMEDKYEELRQGGATENEAIGAVITEFGNIDEVLEEMEIKKEIPNEEFDDVMVVEEEDAYEFIEAKRRAGIGIGLGLLSIMVGVAIFLMIFGIGNLADSFLYTGLVFLFIGIAVGIALFIINGMRLSDYSQFSESFYVLVPEARRAIEKMREAYKRSHVFSLVIGVSICILSSLPVMGAVFLGNRQSYVLIGTGVMLLLIGVALFFFTFTGNIWGAYETLLDHGQTFAEIRESREKARQKNKIVKFMDDIYWPIIVVLFFVWSFGYGSWAYSWLIFVIGGIIYSGVLMIFDIEE